MRKLCSAAMAAAMFLLAPVAALASCHIAGDSIAVGTAEVLRACTVNAKIGVPSSAVIGRVKAADFLVVSAGSNDPANPALRSNLEAIRTRARGKVIWELPAVAAARAVVASVASAHGDQVVAFATGRDGVHPRSYGALGAAVLILMRKKPT